MLTELLRPAGAELARRWLAALLIAPQDEREEIVEAIESRMVSVYGSGGSHDGAADGTLLHVAGERIQKDGFVEQVVRSYSAGSRGAEAKASAKRSGSGTRSRRSARGG